MTDPRPDMAALMAFGFASLGWLLVTGVVTGLVGAAVALANGMSLEALGQDPTAAMTPGVMGTSAFVQAAGIGGVSWALARGFSDADESVRTILLGAGTPWWGWVLAGMVGGVTVGLLPGWIAAQMVAAFPELDGTLAVLLETMQQSAPFGKTLLLIAICVFAPIGEEIAFRGYLWTHLERFVPGWAAWLLTSLLFVAYHLDPIQSTSLLPTALFIGWLRWQSGSVIPAIAAHFVNNLLASVGLFLVGTSEPAQISLASAMLGATATVGACTAAWLVRPGRQ